MNARPDPNWKLIVLGAVALSVLTVTGTAQDIQTISHGETVDINASTVPGKLTLFDFYADWCGPCRSLTPTLERIANANPNAIALRKVDIINWGSDVANQFRIQSIPHLKLYDENGVLLAEGNSGQVMRVLESRLGGTELGSGRSIAPIVLIGGIGALTLFLVFRGRASPKPPERQFVPVPRSNEKPTSGWFVMIQNSLEGPFAEDDLEEMVRNRKIESVARARRRGEATWTTVDKVIEDLL